MSWMYLQVCTFNLMRSYTLQFVRSERIRFDVFLSCLRKQLTLFGECIWKYLTSIWLKVFHESLVFASFSLTNHFRQLKEQGDLSGYVLKGILLTI